MDLFQEIDGRQRLSLVWVVAKFDAYCIARGWWDGLGEAREIRTIPAPCRKQTVLNFGIYDALGTVPAPNVNTEVLGSCGSGTDYSGAALGIDDVAEWLVENLSEWEVVESDLGGGTKDQWFPKTSAGGIGVVAQTYVPGYHGLSSDITSAESSMMELRVGIKRGKWRWRAPVLVVFDIVTANIATGTEVSRVPGELKLAPDQDETAEEDRIKLTAPPGHKVGISDAFLSVDRGL